MPITLAIKHSGLCSLDTETTGIDLAHGAKPYFVTICKEDGEQQWWEWDVDPLTREPQVSQSDLLEIDRAVQNSRLVLQNPKFDFAGLKSIGCNCHWKISACYDTLMAGHLLASNHSHTLDDMVLEYLDIDIRPYEDNLRKACNAARSLARREFPEWRIANKDLPEMPSAKERTWKFDGWLPRTVAKKLGYKADHPWWTVLAEYSNTDSAVTLALFKVQRNRLKSRGLWDIYVERLKLLPVIHKMESRGVTVSKVRLNALYDEYKKESDKAGRICVNIAKSYGCSLALPKSGNNKSLSRFVFEHLNLSPVKKSNKTGVPSLDKTVIEHYQATLKPNSKELVFINALGGKRKRDTALSYMESYRRFWVPLKALTNEWFLLYPSLNPTGTDTLRFSCANPNEQNISKKEGFNLRYCFGPAPGREWWSLDAENIELRIPAFEAHEREMVYLFEHGDQPPYYGSYHMLIFDTLHSSKFAKHGMKCKQVYESSWYQWTKNGNFAVQYGAQESSGTADRAYHVSGAQRRIQSRFKQIGKLSQSMIEFANRNGYVETVPDKLVCPSRGYPLLCTRSQWGHILPTVPLSYHVQGTAMWWMCISMVACQAQLDEWNRQGPASYYMIMQVHDELVFDFPFVENRGNLPKAIKLKKLMEASGDRIGVPTPVSVKYHSENWAKGE